MAARTTYIFASLLVMAVFTDDAKVNLEVDLAERRLSEISALSAENRLSEAAEAVLLDSAEKHAVSIRTRLEKTEGVLSEQDARKLTSRLESGNLRALFEEESPKSPEVMLMSASAVSETAPAVRSGASLKISEDFNTTSISDDMERSKKKTKQEKIERVREEYNKSIKILNDRIDKISKENGKKNKDD